MPLSGALSGSHNAGCTAAPLRAAAAALEDTTSTTARFVCLMLHLGTGGQMEKQRGYSSTSNKTQ